MFNSFVVWAARSLKLLAPPWKLAASSLDLYDDVGEHGRVRVRTSLEHARTLFQSSMGTPSTFYLSNTTGSSILNGLS